MLLGGVAVPAGATVPFSAYALHHPPRLHPAPLAFDPDRRPPGRAACMPRTRPAAG
ncbi:cytochrome P450 [Actinacidiphila glaucinigra]|uniref:cytochrome P450 n=1 Tax=Actinacidiphila glaucinigra TaxID=235986 RepID=UPI00339F52AA